jgi:tetratricopeptide (TPR) repeat protein
MHHVAISGEAGIGKSRIAQTILEQLSSETHTPLRLSCSPHHRDSALHPSITQLERTGGFRREDTIEQRLDKLEAVLARATNDLGEAVPLLAALLSIPTGDQYAPLNLSPQKQKEKTLHVLLGLVEGLAVRHPVLLVVEDAHWSDPTSRELFDLIIDRLPTMRILMIVTFRPEFTPPWVGRSYVTLLSLSRLGPRQSAEMIACLTGGKALPQEIVDQIIDRTDGVPLFIEELTKAVIESGVLTDAGDRFTMAGPLPPLAIPTSLNASLLARLDRLAPTREVAQIAAALGRQFSHELISAVATIPKQQLDDALAQLVNAELIFRRGMPPDAEYMFKHALVQGAAYGTLLRGRRQQIHARIVKVLESQFLEIVVAQPQLMAQHCTEAGLITEAIGYWIKAGRLSFTRSAIVEAGLQLRKGLALVSSLVEGPERRRQELDLLTTLGSVEIYSKGEGAPTAWEAVVRARALCDQLSERSSLGLVLYMQGAHYIARADYAGALQVAEDLLRVASESDDAAHEMRARLTMGRSLHFLGAFSSAGGHFERLLKVPVPEADERSLWFPSDASTRTIALAYLAVNLLYLGHLDRAIACRDRALGLARKSGFPYALAVALSCASHADWLGGARQAALERITELSTLAAQHGFPLFLALADLGHALILCARGKTTEGLARARQAISDCATTGMSYGLTARRAALAYCCKWAGEIDEALALLDAALETANATDERYYEAELHRLKGEWLLAHRPARGAEAESSYQHALAIARRQQAKFWELRAATSLARLQRDQGKRAEARDLLAPIYGWFTEGFDTPVLKDAKALLDQLT